MAESSANLRMTRQRKIILEELHRLDCHPTADELYDQVRKVLPRISLGTVYRNLEVLSEAGQILKLELAGSQKRFDWDARNHYHIRCIRCDRIDNAPLSLLGNLENEMKSETGYQVVGHRLEFFGLCKNCQSKIALGKDKKALLL
ncbi:MAG: transcriptional repressor [Desulfobacterales bacterium]